MNRLILVEGLPGAGKTTFAQMLADALRADGDDVRAYVEGDLHPVDLAWCACLTQSEYRDLCAQYPSCADALASNSAVWGDRVIVAYTKPDDLPEPLYRFCESREVYDGRIGAAAFRSLMQSRWETFGRCASDRRASGVYVFECVLLQNQINELALFQNAASDAPAYLRTLLDSVSALRPVVAYLDAGATDSVACAAAARVDEQGGRVWESRVAEYVEQSPYGVRNGLRGTAGMYRYFAARRELELRTLPLLPVESIVVPFDLASRNDAETRVIERLRAALRDERGARA